MSRFARAVVPGIPHHVTQRGNAQRRIFGCDADRRAYLDLIQTYSALHDLKLLGYCLMSNHVHLVATPGRVDSLALVLNSHGRYAAYLNARESASGHVWQGRFYSCALDESHLWAALRYVERNPVRAGLAQVPEGWRWSSAAAHVRNSQPDPLLTIEYWRERWTAASWKGFLADSRADQAAGEIRRHTHTGRPLGPTEWVRSLEESLGRQLAAHTRRETTPASDEPSLF